jgi:hypothetical protein
MSEESPRFNEGDIDAKLRAERDRLVKLLRELADRIERAPLDRITGALTWIGTAAETFIRTVESVIGGEKPRR